MNRDRQALIVITCLMLIVFTEAAKYTTFSAVLSERLAEELNVQELTITKLNPNDPFLLEPVDYVTIDDVQIIERLLDELKSSFLREERQGSPLQGDYMIQILGSYIEEDGLRRRESVTFTIDDSYIDHYKVLSVPSPRDRIEHYMGD